MKLPGSPAIGVTAMLSLSVSAILVDSGDVRRTVGFMICLSFEYGWCKLAWTTGYHAAPDG